MKFVSFNAVLAWPKVRMMGAGVKIGKRICGGGVRWPMPTWYESRWLKFAYCSVTRELVHVRVLWFVFEIKGQR